MKHLLILITLLSTFAYAQTTLPLREAIEKKYVKVAAKGNGGYQGKALALMLKNQSYRVLNVVISAGQIFASQNPFEQDLMVTQATQLLVQKGETKKISLYSMCIQSANSSPGRGSGFSVGMMATGHLLELAKLISEQDFQTSSAQSAVWAVANGRGMNSLYGQDTSQVRQLAEVVAEATGQPISVIQRTPRVHHITEINSSMDVLIPDFLENARLVAVDSAGEVMQTYFSEKKLEPGFRQFRIGLFHTRGDSAAMRLLLMEGEQLINEKVLSIHDTVPILLAYQAEATLMFDVQQEVKTDVGVYDAQNRLYFIIQKDVLLKEGNHRKRLVVGRKLPADVELFVKFMAADERVVAEARLDPNNKPTTLHPRIKIQRKVLIEIPERIQNVQINIYDDTGNLHQKLVSGGVMQAGKRLFTTNFSHRKGPEAKFFLKVLDGKGQVVFEEKL